MAPATWEHLINERTSELLHALDTRDLSAIHAPLVQAKSSTDNTAVLAAIDKSTTDQLNAISVTACQSYQQAITKYKSAVDAKKDSKLHADQWKTFLDDQQQSARKLITDAMDTSQELAVDLIGSLPTADQESAANVFENGSNVVVAVGILTSQQLNDLPSRAGEFARGDFSAMDSVYKSIVGAVATSVSMIQDITS